MGSLRQTFTQDFLPPVILPRVTQATANPSLHCVEGGGTLCRWWAAQTCTQYIYLWVPQAAFTPMVTSGELRRWFTPSQGHLPHRCRRLAGGLNSVCVRILQTSSTFCTKGDERLLKLSVFKNGSHKEV